MKKFTKADILEMIDTAFNALPMEHYANIYHTKIKLAILEMINAKKKPINLDECFEPHQQPEDKV